MFGKIIVGIITILLSALILMSTYEVLFNYDLPVVQAIKPLQSQSVIKKTISNSQAAGEKTYSSKVGALGEVDYITLPTINSRAFIARERLIGDKYYYRPNNLHYLGLNRDANGDIGDYLLYTSKSFRTIPVPDALQIGDEIVITNTRGKSKAFFIEDKQILPYEEPYVVADDGRRQINIVVDDPQNQVYFLFVAR
jgi:hypothetical protein